MKKAIDLVLVACALVIAGLALRRLIPEGAKGSMRVTEPLALRDGPRLIGRPEAKYRLTVFTDYECPACKRFEREIDSLLLLHGDSVKVVYHPYPLEEVHPQALAAAVLADCALARGLFPAMHRKLFSLDLARTPGWLEEATSSMPPTDTAAIRACTAKALPTETVRQEIAAGKRMNIHGTPGLIVGTRLYIGGRSRQRLEQLLFHE